MLDSFVETQEPYLRVPCIDEYLYVDIRGQFYVPSYHGMRELRLKSAIMTVHINKVPYVTTILNLIQLTWKPVYAEDFVYYLTERQIEFVVPVKTNTHPINLVWKSEVSKVGDMYRIPGFSRYLLTEDDRLYDRKTKSFKHVGFNKNYYATVSVTPDYTCGRPITTVLHRMVAYAKHPYPSHVMRLDVNHIDGDKWNFRVDNLEWVTRRQNNIHAQVTGLKKDSNKIIARNVDTGEVIECYSQAECARHCGVDPRNLSKYLLNEKRGAVRNCQNGRFEFTVIRRVNDKPKYVCTQKTCLVKDTVSGEIHKFNSIAAAAKFIGISNAALKKRHLRGSTTFGNLVLKSYNPLLGESEPVFD